MDLEAIEKWRTKDGEYAERAKELEEATKERDEVRCRLGCTALCCARAWQAVPLEPVAWFGGAERWSQWLSAMPGGNVRMRTLLLLLPPQVRREHEELRKRRLDEFMAGG